MTRPIVVLSLTTLLLGSSLTAQDSNAPQSTQKRIFLIGNSLTWDTVPSKLDGNAEPNTAGDFVQWHVDCGKSLVFIRDNPEKPCVKSSRLWPTALSETQYDFVSVQPHYGTTINEDVEAISQWVQMQSHAIFIIHTGWARHAQFEEEFSDSDPDGSLTHSNAYTTELLRQLRVKYPDREFRCTEATRLLRSIADDIAAGRAPVSELADLYRDKIHMTIEGGRFLMHNAMRKTIGQPLLNEWPKIDLELQAYLTKKLVEARWLRID